MNIQEKIHEIVGEYWDIEAQRMDFGGLEDALTAFVEQMLSTTKK